MAKTASAMRVRRMLSRGLFVVGGAVAGTAAAWTLSSMTAAAESITLPTDLSGFVAQSAVVQEHNATEYNMDKLRHAVFPVSPTEEQKPQQAADLPTQLGQLFSQPVAAPAPAKSEVTKLSQQAHQALDQLGQQLLGHIGWQPRTGASVIDNLDLTKLGRFASGKANHAVDQALVPAPLPVNTAPAGPSDRIAVVAPNMLQQQFTTTSRRGPPSDEAPVNPLPFLPAPLPGSPSLPGSGYCSCGHSSSNDSGVSIDTPLRGTFSADAALSRVLHLASGHVASGLGDQPGVTPD